MVDTAILNHIHHTYKQKSKVEIVPKPQLRLYQLKSSILKSLTAYNAQGNSQLNFR